MHAAVSRNHTVSRISFLLRFFLRVLLLLAGGTLLRSLVIRSCADFSGKPILFQYAHNNFLFLRCFAIGCFFRNSVTIIYYTHHFSLTIPHK